MATNVDVGKRTERVGDRIMGRHDETRWGVLTGEFWTTAIIIVAVLIAAAVADNLDAPRAWWMVAVVGAAYIISRGLAKSGTPHRPDRDSR